ncbi:MAG: sensor histidine kinase [Gemmobacter sp.]
MPVTLRVPLVAAGLMVALGMVASQGVLAILGTVQDARLREAARLHVEGLAVALGPFVLRQDVWEVYDILDRARAASNGQRLLLTVVADAQGRVLAATDPTRAPMGGDIAPFVHEAVPPEAVHMTGARTLRVFAPLTFQGREVGRIVTELDVTDLLAERRRVTVWLLMGNAAATALLAFAGWIAVSRILRPVGLLVEAMQARDGSPRPVAAAAVPAGDPGVQRLFATYNAMATAVEARAEAERRLAERERFVSLGRLSSSLAHEINNPLGGLMNATDTILSFPDRSDSVRQSAELIQRGLSHLRDVSRAILDQNRLDRAGQPLRPEDFEDLRLLYEPEAARRGHVLDWTIAAGAEAMASLPATQVRQVVLNLLLNAGAAAGERGRVGLRVETAPGALVVSVCDSGPGLGQDDLLRLTQAGPVPAGGGVGLRLVHDLVVGMAGTIRHSHVEGMTDITITFPMRSNDA